MISKCPDSTCNVGSCFSIDCAYFLLTDRGKEDENCSSDLKGISEVESLSTSKSLGIQRKVVLENKEKTLTAESEEFLMPGRGLATTDEKILEDSTDKTVNSIKLHKNKKESDGALVKTFTLVREVSIGSALSAIENVSCPETVKKVIVDDHGFSQKSKEKFGGIRKKLLRNRCKAPRNSPLRPNASIRYEETGSEMNKINLSDESEASFFSDFDDKSSAYHEAIYPKNRSFLTNDSHLSLKSNAIYQSTSYSCLHPINKKWFTSTVDSKFDEGSSSSIISQSYDESDVCDQSIMCDESGASINVYEKVKNCFSNHDENVSDLTLKPNSRFRSFTTFTSFSVKE